MGRGAAVPQVVIFSLATRRGVIVLSMRDQEVKVIGIWERYVARLLVQALHLFQDFDMIKVFETSDGILE